jgi:GR25 family glycosyltransferase involved in LPS biosynthesis
MSPGKSWKDLDTTRFKVFLINLKNRPDRLKTAIPQFKDLGIDFEVSVAIDANSVLSTNPFLSRPAEACYTSHLKTMGLIAADMDNFSIIAEDDFRITKINKLKRQLENIDFEEYDLVQIGWLQNTLRDRILIRLTTLESDAFHLLYLITRNIPFIYKRIQNRLRVVRNATFYSRDLVQDDFKSGGHFYFISRKFAEFLSDLNPQPQVPIDNFLANMAATRKFRIARTRKSFVKQTNSPSSIKFLQ